ncbi:unnamed protein product, partial [marine sediment metagenome]
HLSLPASQHNWSKVYRWVEVYHIGDKAGA